MTLTQIKVDVRAISGLTTPGLLRLLHTHISASAWHSLAYSVSMQPRQMNPFRYLEMSKICSIHSGTALPPGMETNVLYEASQDSRQQLPGCVADDLPGVRWHCNLCENLKKKKHRKKGNYNNATIQYSTKYLHKFATHRAPQNVSRLAEGRRSHCSN